MPEEKKFELTPAIAILLAGALIAAAILFVNYGPPQPTVAEGGEPIVEPEVSAPNAQDYWYGSVDAPIVLVEYSDFQCPYCSSIHPSLKRIVDESDGEIAWVYRHLPLESIHPQALPSALASECIAEQLGSEGFWAFADNMFANQSGMSAARYEALAGELGADVAQFSVCMESQKYLSKVDAQALEAAQNGGTGTPFTVVVKGDTQIPISGALPYAQLTSVINTVR
jgi:protein-disulfide isomerase